MPSLQIFRNRRSAKKRERKRSREQQQQEPEDPGEDTEGRHGTSHQVEEGYMSRKEDTHNLDNTTARITSLLQRIEGEESRAGDGK